MHLLSDMGFLGCRVWLVWLTSSVIPSITASNVSLVVLCVVFKLTKAASGLSALSTNIIDCRAACSEFIIAVSAVIVVSEVSVLAAQ